MLDLHEAVAQSAVATKAKDLRFCHPEPQRRIFPERKRTLLGMVHIRFGTTDCRRDHRLQSQYPAARRNTLDSSLGNCAILQMG